jgi:hypothetical protein
MIPKGQEMVLKIDANMTLINMYLTVDNETYLFEWCDPEAPPKIKYYVYRMTYSSVMKNKCKLVR